MANWDETVVKLKCRKNHWEYENRQGTIKKPYKNATRNAKKNNFFKNCWLLGPFSKNQCFWKMGMAGIKWWPCLCTTPSFSANSNEEAFLKISFKNIDWFQITFSKKALKTKNFWKILNFFLHFYLHFQSTYQWYIVCFHTPNFFPTL